MTAPALDPERLRELTAGLPFVRRLEVLEVTTSTHDEARRLAEAGAPSGTVVLANHQTAGRGRLGRRWHSPPGLGLYLSALFRPAPDAAQATRWTLASSLAACEACLEVAPSEVTIVWPNDLYHGSRKLAGTLASLRSLGSALEELIVGTGFNVNHGPRDFPSELADRATSLRIARGGQPVDREALAAAYLGRLAERVQQLESGDWEGILEAWLLRAPLARGAPVRVFAAAGSGASFAGLTRGVDPSGMLRVERDSGVVAALRPGDSVAFMGI